MGHHHSALCLFSSGSNDYIHPWLIYHQNEIKVCRTLCQCWKWVVRARHASWHANHHSTCRIYFTQAFCFRRCLVRIWNTFAGEIPTSVAVAIHKVVCVFKCSMNTVHMCCSYWLITVRVICCVFPPSSNGIHPQVNCFMWWGMGPYVRFQWVMRFMWHFSQQHMEIDCCSHIYTCETFTLSQSIEQNYVST